MELFMHIINRLFPVIALIATLSACSAAFDTAGAINRPSGTASSVVANKPLITLAQQKGKVMLVLGQDLVSINHYAATGRYPTPAGVTTYLSFYNLTRPEFPAYGALGQDMRGRPVADVNWGAGPLNAAALAQRYPNSALVIGLNMAEGNAGQLWVPDGLAGIAAGRYDANIRRLARFCNSLSQPVYLRIAYEFDGAWNLGYEKPLQYIAAYRRIVDVMRREGVSNTAYVWQASASPVDDLLDGKREDIKQWYPGDAYVDWLGLSWFDVPDRRYKSAPTQRELADEVVRLARVKQKPVMIAEAAPQGFDLSALTVARRSPLLGGRAGTQRRELNASAIWQQWFVPFCSYIRSNADVIRAVAYINADWDAQPMWSVPYSKGYWGDSRVHSNATISRYWQQEMSDETFWLHGDGAYAVGQ